MENLNAGIDLPRALKDIFADRLSSFCLASEDAGFPVSKDPNILAAASRVFSFSDFVSRSCIRNPGILNSLIRSGDLQRSYEKGEVAEKLKGPLLTLANEILREPSAFSDNQRIQALQKLLRDFRNREMVRIAWRDLEGWATLSETVRDLSNLADACLEGSLGLLYEWLASDKGTPVGKNGSRQSLVVIGMGKLGGKELNFSSDIDLILTFPDPGETQGTAKPISN